MYGIIGKTERKFLSEGKMTGTGIVIEYNPFHNGHKYHLQKSSESNTVIIGVMSGDFVQRGEPSIVDRWTKTQMALENGIDIVVELPSFYSAQSAEIFAKGAIGILKELQCKKIVFGSETGELQKLVNISKYQESEEFRMRLNSFLKEGKSYPVSYNLVMKEMLKTEVLNSNDILALEYIKAIKYWEAEIVPVAIKRENVGYYDKNIVGNFASATRIRELIKNGNFKTIENLVPKNVFEILKNYKRFPEIEKFYPLIRYEILKNHENLKDIQDMEIGFQNTLYKNAVKFKKYQDFFENISSKRYTKGRVQRVLNHVLLGITKEFTKNIKQNIPYVRILGFNQKGKKYLSKIKKNPKIITSYKKMSVNFSKETCEAIEFNERCSMIYRLVCDYENFKFPIVYIDKNN